MSDRCRSQREEAALHDVPYGKIYKVTPTSFEPEYLIEVDPEFPADGVWADPVHCYDCEGSPSDAVGTRWGAPFVVRVTPTKTGQSWIGMFESGGLGEGASEAHACPHPAQLCIVVGGLAYLVNAESPSDGATPLLTPVTQIVAVDNPPQLLLVTFSELVALGRSGIVWRSGRVALDGLRVETVVGDELHCVADNMEGGSDRLVLDPTSGEQTSGRRLDSIWPPDALA